MLEAYERLLGPKDSSFEAGGVRFIGLSPFQILEEPSLVGETRAAWLDRELRKGSRPAIVFQHMPIADDNYYVNDTELLRGVLQKHDVRALFVGHTHELAVDVFNGVTQITGDSTRDGGWTFWCELVQTGKSIALTVDAVEVTTALQAGGTPTPKRVTQVPFTGERPGAKLAPHSVAATAVGAASVKIDANLAGRKATGVVANVYPQHVYGEQQKVAQTPMTESGNGKYTVTLPIERPVPGVHPSSATSAPLYPIG